MTLAIALICFGVAVAESNASVGELADRPAIQLKYVGKDRFRIIVENKTKDTWLVPRNRESWELIAYTADGKKLGDFDGFLGVESSLVTEPESEWVFLQQGDTFEFNCYVHDPGPRRTVPIDSNVVKVELIYRRSNAPRLPSWLHLSKPKLLTSIPKVSIALR